MVKSLFAGAALLLVVAMAAGVAANEGCKDTITGYSGTYGKRNAGALDRFNNQTSQWRSKGAITKVNAYYSFNQGCVQGLKLTYGYNSQDARLLGQEKDLTSRDLKLDAGEQVVKVQIKQGSCVEFLRMVTSAGRIFEIGNSASAAQLVTNYPNNKATGFLAAVRGYEEYTKVDSGATARGALKTLQFVWANCNPLAANAVPRPSTPAPAPAPTSAPELQTPTDGPTELKPEAPSCPAMLDMCSEDASITSTAYCPIVSPYKQATCLGGCCSSSGKCTSSSCAISGLGKEVSNTICYGLNPAIAIGASPNCRGLACQLSIPGCTSDLLGGSCVGTVVDLTGAAKSDNPAGAALLGYPCLDVTPSDKTLTADGKLSLTGPFVAKLWSICDCKAPASIPEAVIPLPKVGKLNVTDLKSLVDLLKPSGDGVHPLQAVLDAVKAKIPPMVIPESVDPANVTSALGFLGSLVGSQNVGEVSSGKPSAVNALVDLVKGASAVAAAGNSTNPLGALLGALAPKEKGNGTNPLAGLSNLVTALAPQGADSLEKSDVLSSILGALSSGTSAAPSADLVGAVSKILAGAGGDSPAADLAGVLSKFKPAAGNLSELVHAVTGAVNQGKDAASGKVDLAGILAKAQQYVGGAGGASPDGTPSLGAIVSGIQALAKGERSAAGNNPLAFLAALSPRAGAEGAGAGGMSLQSMVDMASKVGPVLQQLKSGGAGAGAGGASPLAGILSAIAGGEGGSGVDLNNLVSLTGKVAPLLQALGGGSGPGGDPLAAILGAVGLGEGGAGGGPLNMGNVKGLFDLASKAGPVLQALNKAGGGGSSLAGLQNFLDSLPKKTPAAA